MKKKVFSIISILSLFAILIVGGTYAFSDYVSVLNHIETGDVNIGIEEYMLTDTGKEVLFQNNQVVYPGQEISKIPRILNYEEPCWIRASVSYSINDSLLNPLSDENIVGISEDWVKAGDFWYYKKPVPSGGCVDFFKSVVIPPEWTKSYSGKDLKIEIRADAVQEVHFDPDFTAMSPWSDIEIEKCIHEVDGKLVAEKQNVKLSVEFSGTAYRLVAVPEDFFSNFSKLMPGDEFVDTVTIKNTTDRDAEIFFNTGLDSLTEEQLDLLRHINLQISFEGTSIYEGDLIAERLNNKISLGIYHPGDGKILTFKITVPAELNNAYAVRDSNVRWVFTVEQDDPVPTETPTPTPAAQEHLKGNLNTGDNSPIAILAIAFGVGAAIFGAAVLLKNRKKA